MRIKFRFRAIPFVATLILISLGVALGQWQTRRAVEKEAIETKLISRQALAPVRLGEALLSPDEVEYRRVTVRGEFVPSWPVYLDNRPLHGAAGFYLLMPFHIADTGRYVLVARGWVPRSPIERTRLPTLTTPVGRIEIEGVARRNPGRLLNLGANQTVAPATIVQNLDIAAFGAASKLPLQPFLLEQTSATSDGLVRDWPRPSSGAEVHRGYAFQWYALALMTLIFFIATGFRNGKK
ncbi:MAG: cytochrome oxidase biosynthesis protein [Gallionellales bacterium RBG_16_56_9]|nr:MAG: cytochrome oxidase biosynthesis protein [Gallionellales bacterium RBG_16_56_9]